MPDSSPKIVDTPMPCSSCGYDLRGIVAHVGRMKRITCSECGARYFTPLIQRDCKPPAVWSNGRWILLTFVPAVFTSLCISSEQWGNTGWSEYVSLGGFLSIPVMPFVYGYIVRKEPSLLRGLAYMGLLFFLFLLLCLPAILSLPPLAH